MNASQSRTQTTTPTTRTFSVTCQYTDAGYPVAQMVDVTPLGKWVRLEDYDTLRAQNAELVKALERIKSIGDDNQHGRDDAFAGTMYNLADAALAKVQKEAQP